MLTITLTSPGVGQDMTIGQWRAAVWLAKNLDTPLVIGPRTFDLPDGYVTFRQEHEDGRAIYGGIDPDGAVHT